MHQYWEEIINGWHVPWGKKSNFFWDATLDLQGHCPSTSSTNWLAGPPCLHWYERIINHQTFMQWIKRDLMWIACDVCLVMATYHVFVCMQWLNIFFVVSNPCCLMFLWCTYYLAYEPVLPPFCSYYNFFLPKTPLECNSNFSSISCIEN